MFGKKAGLVRKQKLGTRNENHLGGERSASKIPILLSNTNDYRQIRQPPTEHKRGQAPTYSIQPKDERLFKRNSDRIRDQQRTNLLHCPSHLCDNRNPH